MTALGGVCLVTADHGNAEKMLEDDGVSPHTAHTTNLVPLLVTEKGIKLRNMANCPTSRPQFWQFSVLPCPYKCRAGKTLIEQIR